MAIYDIVVKDADGFDILVEVIDGMAAAQRRAKYLLTEDHARCIGTTRDALGVHKVEVQDRATSACLWDAFV